MQFMHTQLGVGDLISHMQFMHTQLGFGDLIGQMQYMHTQLGAGDLIGQMQFTHIHRNPFIFCALIQSSMGYVGAGTAQWLQRRTRD